MPRSACLTPAELSALHLGDVPETALAELGGHLETCSVCEQAARALDEVTDPLLAAFRRSVATQPNGVEEQPPQRIGDYEILAELGRGGMGVVYRARHVKLQRVVALKMLLEGEFAERGERQRFLREAEAVARLQHPHIVQIFDVGEYAAGGGLTRPYFTLEFVDGGSLAARLAGRPVEPRQAAAWLEPVARAIHYAHEHGIVHRDLKPSNVLLSGDGQPKLCDFGIAKLLSGADAKTRSGTILGTPEYMAPEQAAGKDAVGPAADIHALGALLYTMLTGRPPFQGAALWDTVRQVQSQEPVPPRRLQPTAPRDLETICLKCLRKEPEKRYASAQALADDLRRFLDEEPILARPVGSLERAWRWGKRHPREAVLTALVLTAFLVVAGGWLWWARDRAARVTQTTRAVEEALREATFAHGQAKGAPVGELAPWTEAVSAAKRGEGLLAQSEVDPLLRERVGALVVELTEAESAARELAQEVQRDRRMVAELEEVRLSKTAVNDDDFDYGAAAPLYAAAFRNYGIDVLTLDPAEAAARIRASRIRVELTAALDDWTYLMGPRGVVPPLEVRRLHEIALAADPDRWRSHMREAVRRQNLQALRDAAKSADVAALPCATLHLLGEALATSGDVPASVALLRRAQLAHPNDAWINSSLAWSLRKLSPPLLDDALRYHTAAWALRPESPGMAYNVAHALDQKGALDEAIATYREAIRLKPDYAKAHTNLGADLFRKGVREEALAELREAIRLKPDLVQAHYNLGGALHAKGELNAAIAAYREAIRLRPNYAPAYYSLGLLAQEGGKLDEAIDYYRQAIKCRNDMAEAHGNLGAALRKKGRLNEALKECREAVRLAPTSAMAHYNLANTLAAKKDFDGAIAEHREALRLDPDYAEAHCNLGIVLLGLGRHAEALAELRRGHELGSKQNNWRYPSAEWVRQAEELAKQAQQKP